MHDVNFYYRDGSWHAAVHNIRTDKEGWWTTETQNTVLALDLPWHDAPDWVEGEDEWYLLETLDMYDGKLKKLIEGKMPK
jgi:hypothetical protein